jgi:hypothetical protein
MKSKNLFFLFSVAFFVLSCSSQEVIEFRKIARYFEKTHNHKITADINKIVVISEGRGCGTCDAAFAQAALKYLTAESVFLITAKGNIVDIQPFINLKQNCFFDWQLDLSKFSEFGSSRVIYLKDNKIDTTIVINTKEINQQLEFFRQQRQR